MTDSRYSPSEANPCIWVFLEHSQGTLAPVSLELLAKGRELADGIGWQLVGLLMGHGVAPLVKQAITHGADQVILAEHSLLEHFTVDGYTQVAFQAVMTHKPDVFLLGATPDGRDLAGRLAVRLRTGLNADCSDLHLDPKTGILVSEVSGFGGGVLALIEMRHHRPQMATVRPGVFPPPEADASRSGQVIRFPVELSANNIHTRIVEQVTGDTVDLTQVPVIVAGGRGITGRFDLLRELADLLGGEVGATRPPVDEGHIPRERQIGQTGVVCRPKVALCCGISGAFHFLVGVQQAEVIIAINNDPQAPIFEQADYCIVGDALQIVPALVSAMKAMEHPA
jgi:electron transfer flavoprotein alpha subunit